MLHTMQNSRKNKTFETYYFIKQCISANKRQLKIDKIINFNCTYSETSQQRTPQQRKFTYKEKISRITSLSTFLALLLL